MVEPFLDPGEVTVGTAVHIDHVASAEIGQSVTVLAELVAVRRRRLVFRVEGRCGRTVIGRGLHERAIIERSSFPASS
jgi:predicted thioesterase